MSVTFVPHFSMLTFPANKRILETAKVASYLDVFLRQYSKARVLSLCHPEISQLSYGGSEHEQYLARFINTQPNLCD